MSKSPLELPGSDRALLRAAVEALDKQVLFLSARTTLEEYRAAAETLRDSWTALVKLLALGEAPALRECSRCKHLGMREATRCGYCWAELAPMPMPS
jgi:hypothetical protein